MTDRPQNKNLKPFKKGQSGNPSGKPKVPTEIREAQKVTSQEFVRVASEFLLMDRRQIKERLENPTASMLEMLIGGIIAKAATTSDYQRANFILDRTIGRVAVDINASVDVKSLHVQLVEAMGEERE